MEHLVLPDGLELDVLRLLYQLYPGCEEGDAHLLADRRNTNPTSCQTLLVSQQD